MKKTNQYSKDLMYDVVATVLKLQGTINYYGQKTDANYYLVHKELSKTRCAHLNDVIRCLRLAEEYGYIRGHGGFWNHHGSGGSKRWHFLKWPPYPYYELAEGNNGK